MIAFENINDLQLHLFKELKRNGDIIVTRGYKTIELINISLQLNNIRKRYTSLKKRNWNLNFAIGEFAWHLSASNKLDAIEYYSKEWRNSSPDNNSIFESCYGYKIFNQEKGATQWQKLISLLKKDIFSRRAVLNLYESNNNLDFESKDIACTCSIQFLYRNSKLNATVYMRSNDLIWGLPNDIFFFTMLQELLALELGVEVGTYNHMVGSLHLYERHFELAESILDENDRTQPGFEMPAMEQKEDISTFLSAEECIRKGLLVSNVELANLNVHYYWKHLLEVLLKTRQKNLSTEGFSESNPYFKTTK